MSKLLKKELIYSKQKVQVSAAFFVHPKTHLYKLWTEINFLTHFVQSPF